MTTSTIHHRPAVLVAIAAAFAGALVAVTPDSAHSIPQPDHHHAVDGRTAPDRDHRTNGHRTHGHPVERPCFIQPFDWDDSLDGPLPRCHTSVS